MFVARQPVLDAQQQTLGYEVLYRSSTSLPQASDLAYAQPSSAFVSTVSLPEFKPLVSGRTAFLKTSTCALTHRATKGLAPANTVIEVPASSHRIDGVVEAAQELQGLGFQIAIEDPRDDDLDTPLARLANLVKVNISAADQATLRSIAEEFAPRGVRLVATGVDTQDPLDQLKKLGFEYFQGFFFACRMAAETGEITPSTAGKLMLLREINRRELDLDGLARVIGSDLGLTHKLLTLMSSAAFALRQHVTSISHAVHMLGQNGVRKWAAAILLRELAEHKPPELAIHSLTRGGFCEIFAERGPLYERSSEMYLMGLFSHLDAILDRPMDLILDELPLAPDIKDALLGEPNEVSQVLEMARAYEKANWQRVEKIARDFAQQEERVASAYRRAVAQADATLV